MANPATPARSSGDAALVSRWTVAVTGIVQGVGFRPFVAGLARLHGVGGWVRNDADGVHAEIEGDTASLAALVDELRSMPPPLAKVESVSITTVPVRDEHSFRIVASRPDATGRATRTTVPADVATCPECLAELTDPADRRYRHPFISCTNCGPRFTITTGLPYDRPTTTMARFAMCTRCAAEYADPDDRRYHAQTIACRDCGPTLELVGAHGTSEHGDDALSGARQLLADGGIVAVKGIGGYHLMCDATDEAAVATLRKRKDRGDKPFAVLVADVAGARRVGFVDRAEAALLDDPRRPVVLLRRRASGPLAPSVAPEHPDVGVLLPPTPLHQLLLGVAGDRPQFSALVLTSGNVAGEPIVIDDDDALTRLAPLADAWLRHDRPITVPCDDSVVRVVAGVLLPVRRSRGFAPLPIRLPVRVRPALAVGGDVKNTFCLGTGHQAWLSAHIGDMDDLATQQALETAVDHLGRLTGVEPLVAAVDTHPAYRSSAWARRRDLPIRTVQHHHAHIASAMADNGHDGSRRVLGVAFDGTGHGVDGAIWGGELLVADYARFERAAHLRYVPLPGGDAGVRNPCRMALSHLRSAGVAWDDRLPPVRACCDDERNVLARQLDTGLACAPTSSMGRLFDAMSSLAGVVHRIAYEAEAAMRFEELARDAIDGCGEPYVFASDGDEILAAPVVAAAAGDVLAGVPAAVVGARFHLAVAEMVAAQAVRLRRRYALNEVALSGGVFLNALLTELCRDRLVAGGFAVLAHHQVPPSDAGLALGQLVVGARSTEEETSCA